MDVKEACSVKLEGLKGQGWVVMYPSYLDKTLSVSDGRKIPSVYCCENPTADDIGRACVQLGLSCLVENKRYPKMWWVPGRCRIRTHNSDGSPCNPIINCRKELYKEIGKLVAVQREEAAKAAATAVTAKQNKKNKKRK